MRSRSQRRGRWAVLGGAVTALVALLAGCSGGAETMSDSGGSVADSTSLSDGIDAPEVAAKAPVDGPVGGAAGDSARGAAPGKPGSGVLSRPVPGTRAVIRKGEVSLVTKEMNRARVEIDDLLGRHGGYLASEDTSNDRAGRPERSVLVLRVPEPAFDEVMTELTEIGRTERADRRSEDVTAQVIDVDTRVATQEASLARLQRFLRQATNVDDMIRIESEIATRQAELESLKAQQKYLSDNTSMSTVTVRLRTPAAPPPEPEKEQTGFLVGLSDGWQALKGVLVATATVAGALLPFAVMFALLGVPAWLLLRAARRRRSSTPPVAPEAG